MKANPTITRMMTAMAMTKKVNLTNQLDPACDLRTNFVTFWDGKEKPNRKTEKKIAILQRLYASKFPLTEKEICTQVRKQIPTISETTVYRTLKRLVEEGLAIQVQLIPDIVHYERVREAHAHFVCEVCHSIADVEMDTIENRHVSGKVHSISLTYSGRCATCAAKNTKRIL